MLVWAASYDGARGEIEAIPLYQQLDAVGEGREVFLDVENRVLYGALSFSTVLSMPFALDRLVRRLAAAVDGDPATTVPAEHRHTGPLTAQACPRSHQMFRGTARSTERNTMTALLSPPESTKPPAGSSSSAARSSWPRPKIPFDMALN